MMDPARKKDMILSREFAFADAVGAAVFEKPKVSVWMIFIPILFLYFVFRMQRFKKDRMKFNEDFMSARREAMDMALEASAADGPEAKDSGERYAGLPQSLQEPYGSWISALSRLYRDLLSADGRDFEALVRTAYPGRDQYLEALERLDRAEKEFYAALKPLMAGVEGTDAVMAAMASESLRLRKAEVDRIFQ
nr:hypothetical protein [Desulfobacula sp.]